MFQMSKIKFVGRVRNIGSITKYVTIPEPLAFSNTIKPGCFLLVDLKGSTKVVKFSTQARKNGHSLIMHIPKTICKKASIELKEEYLFTIREVKIMIKN